MKQQEFKPTELLYIEKPSPTGKDIIAWSKQMGEELLSAGVKTVLAKSPLPLRSPEKSSVKHVTTTGGQPQQPSFQEMFKHRKPVLYTDIKARVVVTEELGSPNQLPSKDNIISSPVVETLKEQSKPQEQQQQEQQQEPQQELSQVQEQEPQQQLSQVQEQSPEHPREQVLEVNNVVPQQDSEIVEFTAPTPVAVFPLSELEFDTPESLPDELANITEPVDELINKVNYLMPGEEILGHRSVNFSEDCTDEIIRKGVLLEQTLANFGVKVQVVDFCQGPAITRFELQPAPGVKVSRIVALADDIALSLAAPDVRIEAPVPGKSVVGIEVPNEQVAPVYFRELVESTEFATAESHLVFALGKDIGGQSVVADLAKMPHLLIAGSTGSGKSVCMNALIASILYRSRPDQVKFLMIDPKMVELSTYNGIPHLIAPVITDPKKATTALRWVVSEMENRYNLFADSGVRNITGYNLKQKDQGGQLLPLVVVVIDELADLMMVASRDVEDAICRLAQMARAAGIHLVIATQRPSVDVITGIIKANIPSRIAFAVSSQVDSRTILDMAGAEKLLGRGDMLFYPTGMPKPLRVQGVFVSDSEIEQLVRHLKAQGKPEYLDAVTNVEQSRSLSNAPEEDDELLNEAAKTVILSGQASVSFLQRRLRVGYARAARLIDLLEEKGIVGGYEGSKPREVLVAPEEWETMAELL